MNHLIIIAGPTAAGKTDLAIRLAQNFGSEIISADSRQFYSEISIGTSKPSADQLQAVKHHFIGNLSVTNDYNAGLFEKDALACIEDIFSRYRLAFMVGGSGLYLKAISEGFDSLPQKNAALREELESDLEEKGISYLAEKLKNLDPEYYSGVDKLNPQRLIRALEVCMLSGQKYSVLRQRAAGTPRKFSVLKIGLNPPREELYSRIDLRVDEMMQQGLLEEARAMLPFRQLNALQTVGYAELFDHFEGRTSLEEAVSLIKRNTRRFAKRQLTWFRRENDIHWFEPGNINEIFDLIKERTKE